MLLFYNVFNLRKAGYFMKDLNNYLTIAQFAAKLGVSIPTIRNYVKEGKIQPSMVCGSHLYFSPETIAQYSGIIIGRKRNGLNRVESYAVLYVTSTEHGDIPKEKIESAMKAVGYKPLESYDYDQEIQPDEVDDFNNFCESKSFYEILRAKVTRSSNDEIKKINEAADRDLKEKYAKLYSSEAYKSIESTILTSTDKAEREEALKRKEKLDKAYSDLVHSVEETKSNLIAEIRSQYSSEYVDEVGNIAENAPKNSGVRYVKIFKVLRKDFVRNYRYAKYPTIKHYTVFSIVADNSETYEMPFKNIFGGAYNNIFVINRSLLSTDWQNVLNIINNSGVSNVSDLSISK